MTVTLELSPDLEQSLHEQAAAQGLDADTFLQQKVRQLLAPNTPAPIPSGPRIAGLSRGTVVWISDDFDEPLPDEFWLGTE